ncbi:transposable element Tc1 transposase [Trichonephila clavata]|uniref:Transposable element Tc1 transposase n=1 Tax=Trichonephila clavata TaxID=2740835 RepID=A0A8X6HM45_TRICU|nr:transposable element Tc1 transposase [Trichonephila clavata]
MEFRHAIYRLYDEEHVSERKIAQMLGLSPSTVHYWITRRGESATTKSGRPRVTDAHTDQNLYEASRKDPFLSAVDLQKEWTPACSVDTVRNRLKQKGLKCRTPARKPFLTQFHRQMRYVYAHSKLHWSVSEWHRVVFSDEKIFRSSSRGALRVYRPVQGSDRFKEQYLVHSSNPIYGRPRFTLCVWRAFGGKGKIRTPYIGLNDPPKGPDMNPVENVWAELVRRLEIHWRQTGVRNRDQLWEDVLQVFHELPEEYFENLIRSMPRRVRTVSSKHGGWAKY